MQIRKLHKILLIWAILLTVSALLGKTSVASGNSRPAADFLNIGVGARAAAMGGAYTSVTDNVDAAYWNPGGLGYMSEGQIMFSHFSWYQDINYEFLAVGYPVSDKLTLAFNSSFMSYGSIEGYDQFDNPTGEVESTYDLATGLSAGYMLSDNISIGFTGKYIRLSLAGKNASALAADLGVQFRQGIFQFGASVVNVGSKVNFGNVDENLPFALKGGAAVYPFGEMFMTSLELENQFHGDYSIKNGYEFNYQSRYFVRAGFNYIPSQEDRKVGQSLSFGVGAYLGPALFDYTFSPEDKYSSESIHRFSITLSLN